MGTLWINGRISYPTVENRGDALIWEVSRADVDRRVVEDVERTVRLASRTLGLDPSPRVRWLPADTRALRGVTFDDALTEIWVRVQDRDAARDTALHELKHVHQLRGDRYRTLGLATYQQRQDDADRFARTWRWEDTPVVAAAHRQDYADECDLCDRPLPRKGAPHACRPAYTTAGIDALTGRGGLQRPTAKDQYGRTYAIKVIR